MPRSRTATSGRSARVPSSASWPVEASATTSKPSRSRNARRPSRTTRWSSARRTRQGMGWPPHRDRDAQLGPAAGGGTNVETAPQRVQPLADAEEPEAPVAAPGRRFWIEAHAVVTDGADQEVLPPSEADGGPGPAGGTPHAGEGFLDDAAERRLAERRLPARAERTVQRHHDGGG